MRGGFEWFVGKFRMMPEQDRTLLNCHRQHYQNITNDHDDLASSSLPLTAFSSHNNLFIVLFFATVQFFLKLVLLADEP